MRTDDACAVCLLSDLNIAMPISMQSISVVGARKNGFIVASPRRRPLAAFLTPRYHFYGWPRLHGLLVGSALVSGKPRQTVVSRAPAAAGQAIVDSGELEGVAYRIGIPANWNELVMNTHGYETAGSPRKVPLPFRSGMEPLMAQGKLRSIAGDHRLNLDNAALAGHSAGGHLAMWVAARTRLPHDSPLSVDDPLPIQGVVNLAGYGDLDTFRQVQKAACGGTEVAETLLGGDRSTVPDRYRQVSAAAMLPLGKRQILIWGDQDSNTPLWLAKRYVQAAKKSGDPVRLAVVPGPGHFEIADSGSAA